MAQTGQGDGLSRWLVGGLVVGAIVLGLMVAAYEIGYHHGKSQAGESATAKPPAATTATTGQTTPAAESGVALGRRLFTADACAGCHSLNGTAGAGPTVAGLAGSSVALDDGTTVTADDAYLAKAITDPDAQIVEGYQRGVMPGAIASFGLDGQPQDVAALVAFIKAQPAAP